LDIPAEDLDDVRAEFRDKFDERLKEAMRAPWDKLHKMLTGISDKLKEGSDDEKKRYHDSLVTNPLELCALLTKLNVTNDPLLEEARRQVELTMLGVNIESIKEDVESRNDLKSKVDSILGKFNW